MQRLIAAGEIELNKDDVRIRVSLGNVRDAQEIREIVRKPEEVKPELAPEMEIQMSLSVGNVSDPVNFSTRNTEVANVATGIGTSFVPDREYLPIVRVPPQYPARAAERGLEGYVVVVFTVTPMGSTTNIKVVESTDKVFERNAVRAALRFKYKPKVVDGEATMVEGVRTKIEFKLDS
tara:strand:- start:148731 stop:149264 length:534 start_codon:yes stop_codon:yes gene_type:complete